jgi:hypothetical protein
MTDDIEEKPKGRVRIFFKACLDFIKTTDFEVKLKNSDVEGSVSRESSDFAVGLTQNDTHTDLEYKDSKIKVRHETDVKDDSKNS